VRRADHARRRARDEPRSPLLAILADGEHRFEGTVNQYTRDGIMALFGAPIVHEDHAQRACWAALHLADELRRYAEELKRTRGLSFASPTAPEERLRRGGCLPISFAIYEMYVADDRDPTRRATAGPC
jgi:class 3 adenylate cyclase